MEKIKLTKGAVIFSQGEASNGIMYDILSGEAGVYATEDGHEQQLTVARAGDHFGELALLTDNPRSATIRVLSDEIVLKKITKDDMQEYFKEHPAKLYQMMQDISHRIRLLSEDYVRAGHTIAEYTAAKEAGKAISEDLNDAMKRILKRV